MPRQPGSKPTYLKFWIDRNGLRRSAYQRTDPDTGKRIVRPLPQPINSPEWHAAYNRIHAAFERTGGPSPADGDTFEAAANDYLQSSAYRNRSPATRRAYQSEVKRLIRIFGDAAIATIDRRTIVSFRNRLAREKPGAAHKCISVLKKIMQGALDDGLITSDPSAKLVGAPEHKATPRRHWTDAEIDRFLAHAPPHLRIAIAILRHTGLRASDAIRLERSHIVDGGRFIEIITQKTGAEVCIPIVPALAEIILDPAVTPIRHLITRATGLRYLDPCPLRNEIRAHWTSLGYADPPTMHGLRRNAVMSLVEAGCTTEEIQAITGQSPAIIAYYAAQYRRRQVAKRAAVKLVD